MRLSDDAHLLFVEFFGHAGICRPDEFPRIRIYVRKGARLVTGLLLVEGITFGRTIFVHPRYTGRNSAGQLVLSKQLLAHELVHVFQYRREGFFRFLNNYMRAFWKVFRKKKRWTGRSWYEAYLTVPHEVEARKYAIEFREWYKSRKERT